MQFTVNAVLGSLLFFCLVSQAAVDGKLDKPQVLVETVKATEDQKRILVPAKVDAQIQSVVSADIEGHVIKILKPLGAVVKAGEVVMYLENRDPGFTYAKVPVRSPIAGVLSQIAISQMTKVSRNDKLFTVINPKSLKLNVELSSSDALVVKTGSEGIFKFGKDDYKIKVSGISPLVDARTGTASAELEFLKSEKTLPSIGTIGQVTFELNQGQVILIPENAIFYMDGKPHLRIVKPNYQIEKKPVDLGEQRESLFVVKSGVQKGDQVVIRSSRPIKDGEVIELQKPDQSSTVQN